MREAEEESRREDLRRPPLDETASKAHSPITAPLAHVRTMANMRTGPLEDIHELASEEASHRQALPAEAPGERIVGDDAEADLEVRRRDVVDAVSGRDHDARPAILDAAGEGVGREGGTRSGFGTDRRARCRAARAAGRADSALR